MPHVQIWGEEIMRVTCKINVKIFEKHRNLAKVQ